MKKITESLARDREKRRQNLMDSEKLEKERVKQIQANARASRSEEVPLIANQSEAEFRAIVVQVHPKQPAVGSRIFFTAATGSRCKNIHQVKLSVLFPLMALSRRFRNCTGTLVLPVCLGSCRVAGLAGHEFGLPLQWGGLQRAYRSPDPPDLQLHAYVH